MKRIKRNILVALTVLAMVASTGVGVFATEGIGPDDGTNAVNTEATDETEAVTTESPAQGVDEVVQEETPAADPSNDLQEPLRAGNAALAPEAIPGDGTVLLRWNGAQPTEKAYDVYYSYSYIDEEEGSETYGEEITVDPQKANTTEITAGWFEVTGLTNDINYTFRIQAVEDPDVDFAEISAAPVASTLERARLRVSSSHNCMVLEWDAVPGANGYIVQRRVNNGKWANYNVSVVSKEIDNDYYKEKNSKCVWTNANSVTNTKKYRYRIKAVVLATDEAGDLLIKDPSITNIHKIERYFVEEKAAYCTYYSSKSKAKKTCVKPMYIKVKPKMNRKLTSRDKYKGKHKSYTFKKGVAIKCYGFTDGCYYFKKKIGSHSYTFRISRINAYGQKALYVGSFKKPSKGNYTKHEAELFVNDYMKDKYGKAPRGSARWYKKGKDKGKYTYCIWVSYYTQHVFILREDDGEWKMAASLNDKNFPRDSWECSSGKASTPSYTGFNQINNNRARSMKGIPYWNGYHGKMDKEGNFNGIHGKQASYKLGAPASHACIRNANSNAKLIWDAYIQGTRVICF